MITVYFDKSTIRFHDGIVEIDDRQGILYIKDLDGDVLAAFRGNWGYEIED